MIPSSPPTPKRQGPRPLPYHLMSQATALLSSQAALPLWKSGSIELKSPSPPQAELRRLIGLVGDEAFRQALNDETARRIDDFLTGIEAYRSHPYRRDLEPMPEVWRQGGISLVDYSVAGAMGPPVLLVPSLVNRGYILDLTERRSLLRHMRGQGLRPFLVDWGEPGEDERNFGLEDYIAGPLSGALDHILAVAGRPIVLGYCMGGLLGLALAALRKSDLSGLVLLATPWDFHCPDKPASEQLRQMQAPLRDLLTRAGQMPADLLQILFSLQDPGAIERKFRHFAGLKRESAAARNFVALEDWVNDCVPLTTKVAEETLFGWYVDNQPGSGEWRVKGRPVRPAEIDLPALVMIPTRDRIVQAEQAAPLAALLPKARRHYVDGGHVGMLIGARAVTEIYGTIVKTVGTMYKNNNKSLKQSFKP
jgi:polyhydroxyalkanoate synthase